MAAAHRGAVRAMQAFIQQLSDPAEGRVPVKCKELGQLIRQLSLCSAKVEVGQGSAVPETTLDILQKLEVRHTLFVVIPPLPKSTLEMSDLRFKYECMEKSSIKLFFLTIPIQILDVALSKQKSQQEQETHMRSISPVRERISTVSRGITSPPRFPQAHNAKATRRPKTSAAIKKSKL